MPYKSEWPARSSVVPKSCDWNQWSVNDKILFISVVRAIFILITFCICVSFLAIYYEVLSLATEVQLALVIALNISQLIVITFYTYYARSGNWKVVIRWLIVNIVVTVIFAVALIVMLSTMDVKSWNIIFGIKLIIISVWVTYRNWWYYLVLAQSNAIQLQV